MSGLFVLQSATCSLQNIVMKHARVFFATIGFIRDSEAIPFDNAVSQVQIKKQAERLFKEYGNSILRLAYSYLHNMSDAEEVLQDALIQFIKTVPKFETAEHEKAWLIRVSINISKNRIKYSKIRKSDELNENLIASEKEDLAMVWDAVKKLPAKYSEVVHLYYHHGYSTIQIADLLSKKEATIRSLLQRARIKLKVILREVYDFEE